MSRSRFWGTPLPLWISEDGEEIVVMDSIEKLERLSGVKVCFPFIATNIFTYIISILLVLVYDHLLLLTEYLLLKMNDSVTV